MSTDPHKMGLAPIPSGCILFRKQQHLNKITREIPYLQGASSTQASILGTRPAASILATWAIMKHLGREGYRNLVEMCMKRTKLALDRIMQNRMLNSAIEPVMNIIGMEIEQGKIQQVVDQMEKRGWSMATSPDPPTIRLVIMPHVTERAIHSFFDDLDVISKNSFSH